MKIGKENFFIIEKIITIIVMVLIVFLSNSSYANDNQTIIEQQEEFKIQDFIKNAEKFTGEFFEEALIQAEAALHATQGKSLFLFYKSAVLFGAGKTKEGILQLEKAMEKAPRQLKKFVELNPSILQNQQVVDVVARFKQNKKS